MAKVTVGHHPELTLEAAMEEAETTDSRTSDFAAALPKLRECPGEALCEGCFWWVHNGGQCPGCNDDYQKRCFKQVCNYNCYDCSGGRHARTPGCCGHAPTAVLKRWKELLQYPLPDYKTEPIQVNCRLIPVIYAQIRNYRIPENFPQIDAWAVPVHKIASKDGRFRSNDLKDYLGLPSDRKLILTTCAADDYQEMLWGKGPQIDFNQHGIDYWFPAHFSIYDGDSKLYQFASAKRQQFHAIWIKSQFVWFRLGEHISIEFLNPIRDATAVIISTNQMYSNHNKAILYNEVKVADSVFSPETKFFIVGRNSAVTTTDNRICYEINTNWLMRSLKGRGLARQKVAMSVSTGELLNSNLKETLQNVYSSKY